TGRSRFSNNEQTSPERGCKQSSSAALDRGMTARGENRLRLNLGKGTPEQPAPPRLQRNPRKSPAKGGTLNAPWVSPTERIFQHEPFTRRLRRRDHRHRTLGNSAKRRRAREYLHTHLSARRRRRARAGRRSRGPFDLG